LYRFGSRERAPTESMMLGSLLPLFAQLMLPQLQNLDPRSD
jgi:hypothetical protein